MQARGKKTYAQLSYHPLDYLRTDKEFKLHAYRSKKYTGASNYIFDKNKKIIFN
jgi:hypothetical protein